MTQIIASVFLEVKPKMNKMFPIRCWTCNNLIAHKYDEWLKRIDEEHPRQILDSMGMTRMCCRRMFLTHVHITTDIINYSNIDHFMDDAGTFISLEPKNIRRVTCD